MIRVAMPAPQARPADMAPHCAGHPKIVSPKGCDSPFALGSFPKPMKVSANTPFKSTYGSFDTQTDLAGQNIPS
jgi:hypothetical protein